MKVKEVYGRCLFIKRKDQQMKRQEGDGDRTGSGVWWEGAKERT